jgi:hypothetical protein
MRDFILAGSMIKSGIKRVRLSLSVVRSTLQARQTCRWMRAMSCISLYL